MIRSIELLIASRLASRGTRFAFVIHTEGLASGKVTRSLRAFGNQLKGHFRPLLTVVTPLSPQYMIDPLQDRERTDFVPRPIRVSDEMMFREALKDLARDFDIGYHGHFFGLANGRCHPVFKGPAVSRQFREECKLLVESGFKPTSYAGGWWYISNEIVSLLKENGFKFDSTLNDLHTDSFARPQPFGDKKFGEPSWLDEGVLEVPSARSAVNLGKAIAPRRTRKFVVLSAHDYDFAGPMRENLGRFVARLAEGSSVLSVEDFINEAIASMASDRVDASA